MPKEQTKVAEQPPQTAEEEITLAEFCMRASKTDRRVELLAGFHASEQRASRLKSTETAYRDRFEAFANQPA